MAERSNSQGAAKVGARETSPSFLRPLNLLIWSSMLASLLFATGVAMRGYGVYFEEQAQEMRDTLRSKPASGQVHIVEIDAASIARLKSWPWPRSTHGMLVDRLHEAGVATLAFDVDFSAPTQAAEDRAFAAALDRFGGSVILATFRQSSGSASSEIVENLPIDELAQHAFLGSVNVDPDHDGQMRSYSSGTVTNQVPRPSIAALMSGAQGKINESFRIDQSIDPATIPRHSYADILAGKLANGELSGKTIVVGATAIEFAMLFPVTGLYLGWLFRRWQPKR
jgi:diguanylate cyclase